MSQSGWTARFWRGFVLAAVVSWAAAGTAQSQQAKPTDEDVDRAIRVCSLGTKTDAKVEGGLNLLKRRILSGEGSFSYAEIPSVIGSGMQTEEGKIQVFDRIQKCVVTRVYGAAQTPQDVFWRDTGMQADWPDRDFSCTQGASPNSQLCNAGTRGRVAVCWLNRRTGECGGATAWCTYKDLTLDTPPTGVSPGRVYVCDVQASR
jgi:hypothetical protein